MAPYGYQSSTMHCYPDKLGPATLPLHQTQTLLYTTILSSGFTCAKFPVLRFGPGLQPWP